MRHTNSSGLQAGPGCLSITRCQAGSTAHLPQRHPGWVQSTQHNNSMALLDLSLSAQP